MLATALPKIVLVRVNKELYMYFIRAKEKEVKQRKTNKAESVALATGSLVLLTAAWHRHLPAAAP